MSNNTKYRFLEQVKTYSAEEYLSRIVGFKLPLLVKIDLIEFNNKYGLKNEVINVLIHYAYHIVKSNLLLVAKIAKYWELRDIATAEEAMEILKTEHNLYNSWANEWREDSNYIN